MKHDRIEKNHIGANASLANQQITFCPCVTRLPVNYRRHEYLSILSTLKDPKPESVCRQPSCFSVAALYYHGVR